jgi:hypothetical protein
MAKAPKVESSHQVGNLVRKRSKKGQPSKAKMIVAVAGKGRSKVKWTGGDDKEDDKEYASTSLLVALPTVVADEAARHCGPDGDDAESDADSDDDSDQFEAAREEDGHELTRKAFKVHARSFDGETQGVKVYVRLSCESLR